MVLSGKPGYFSAEADARGTPILLGQNREVSAIGGVDLVTHIDKGLQILAEKKLREGIEKYGAKGGSIVISEPKTGAIVASASFPSYSHIDLSQATRRTVLSRNEHRLNS